MTCIPERQPTLDDSGAETFRRVRDLLRIGLLDELAGR